MPNSRGALSDILTLPPPLLLVVKSISRLSLRVALCSIDSIFALMGGPLRSPDYTSAIKRAKSVNISFKRSPSMISRIWLLIPQD
ncbi:transposase [Escherichia coli]